jgi:hypothetical protein
MLVIADITTARTTELPLEGGEVAWSPDGHRLARAGYNTVNRVALVELRTATTDRKFHTSP